MQDRVNTKRLSELRELALIGAAPNVVPYLPSLLTHVYLKLDFKSYYENAKTAEDARGFLRSVARAAFAAHHIAEQHAGVLLEVQGSTLHIALPQSVGGTVEDAKAYIGELHGGLTVIFSNHNSRVESWRITVDTGKTLVVVNRGVHGDHSLVSLGKAANRPAKHLYAQLDLPEAEQNLKKFHFGIRRKTLTSAWWEHRHLDSLLPRILKAQSIAEEARQYEPKIEFGDSGRITARAYPLAPAGSPSSPSPDRPLTHYGWVMRADLDGFSSRVSECFDHDAKLQEMAKQFNRLMDEAARFVNLHPNAMVQLPWAGDNFTAAAVYESKEEYERALPRGLIELILDYEKELTQVSIDCGFGGWAHGAAGGEVHGNAGGNVYLAGIEVGGRRFLVGVGEGFGRSTQAFGDIDPQPKEIVVYETDWAKLDFWYKSRFEQAKTYDGKRSTLYRSSTSDSLLLAKARLAAASAATTVTVARSQSQVVQSKPHARL